MKTKYYFRKRCIVVVIATTVITALIQQGQAQSTDHYKKQLYYINKLYDSAIYLSFDVKYIYQTDTVETRFKNSELSGYYTLYGSKSYYKIGNIEYMQNDSFHIAAYNDEKFLIVTKMNKAVVGASKVLPLREMIDSMFYSNYHHYNLSSESIINRDDTLQQISFVKKTNDTIGLYDYFKINYRPKTYALQSLEYGFKQPVTPDENDTMPAKSNFSFLPQVMWNVKFKISFDHYRVGEIDPTLFSEARFIHEETVGNWVASDRYLGYRIFYSDRAFNTHK